MYTIELMTILPLLREFQRNGVLRTELPSGLGRLKQPCFVVVELLRGEMTACYVKDSKGQNLLSQEEALQALSAVGKLNWTFDALSEQELLGRLHYPTIPTGSVQTSPLTTGPLQTPPSLPVAPWSYRPRIPRRLVLISQAEVNTWPRKYRQIYVLIDGTRSVDKIAAILSTPSQNIEDILQEMQTIGAILLEDR